MRMARAGAPVCLGDRYGATPGAIERAFAAARQSELGRNRRSTPMTTASTAIPHCRSRTGTTNTGGGLNDGTFQKQTVATWFLLQSRLADWFTVLAASRWGD